MLPTPQHRKIDLHNPPISHEYSHQAALPAGITRNFLDPLLARSKTVLITTRTQLEAFEVAEAVVENLADLAGVLLDMLSARFAAGSGRPVGDGWIELESPPRASMRAERISM